MTNYEKWKLQVGYTEPKKIQIICINSSCEDCPIYKKFRICEGNENKIEEWLNSEVEKDV